jgi:hypothetical protein
VSIDDRAISGDQSARKSESHFYAIQTRIFEATLPVTQKMLLLAIGRFENRQTRHMYPGTAKLAELTSLDPRTVQKLLAKLVESNYLACVARSHGGRATEYIFGKALFTRPATTAVDRSFTLSADPPTTAYDRPQLRPGATPTREGTREDVQSGNDNGNGAENGKHRTALDVLNAYQRQWSPKYNGEQYQFSYDADGKLAKSKGLVALDPAELDRRIGRYLASGGEGVLKSRHPFRWFARDISQYGAPIAPEPAPDRTPSADQTSEYLRNLRSLRTSSEAPGKRPGSTQEPVS